jgi:integral membrane protein
MQKPARSAAITDDLTQIRWLRWVSLVEASTLLILLLVAVPLKHAFGFAAATRIMGPVHGAAFVAYTWSVIAVVSRGGWSRYDVARLGFSAFVPFGGFLNAGLLRRKQAELVERPEVTP